MFDTVKMLVRNIKINPERLNQSFIQSSPNINKHTGTISAKYEVKDNRIPYIIYFEETETLLIQASIPKFLYGENVTLVSTLDIQEFFVQLNHYFKSVLDVDIHPDKWRITKTIDVCWNFKVEREVAEYIRLIGKNKLPYKETIQYNHTETVYFKNASSKIKLYDKHKELIDSKQSKEIVDSAIGIVRLEITPSVSDIKKYCKSKQATKLLSKEFFEHTTAHALSQIIIPETIDEMDFVWLKTQKIQTIEMCLAFMQLMTLFNESMLKELYGQSYKNRKNRITQINFPMARKLEQLKIDYDQIV